MKIREYEQPEFWDRVVALRGEDCAEIVRAVVRSEYGLAEDAEPVCSATFLEMIRRELNAAIVRRDHPEAGTRH